MEALTPVKVFRDERVEDTPPPASLSRKALIEEGRRRMEEFRRRSSSPSLRKTSSCPSTTSIHSQEPRDEGKRDLERSTRLAQDLEDLEDDLDVMKTPQGVRRELNGSERRRIIHNNGMTRGRQQNSAFTPVAQGFKTELEKLKKDELDLAAAEWSEQRKRLARLREEFEEEAEDLRESLAEEQRMHQQTRDKLRELESELAMQTSQKDAYQKECASLRSKVHSLASEIEDRARDAVNRLAESHSERDADLAVLNKQLELQVQTIEKTERENHTLRSELAVSNATVQQYSREIETLRANFAAATAEKEKLRGDIDALRAELSQSLLRLQQIEADKERVEKSADDREKFFYEEKQALQVRLSQVQKAQIEYKEEFETCSAKLSQTETVVTELRLAKMDVEENLAICLDENRSLKESLAQAQAKGDDSKRARDMQLAQAEKKAEEAQDKVKELQRSVNSAREAVKFEKSRAEAIKEKLRNVEAELEQSIQTNHKLQSSSQLLREEINSKAETIDFLESKIVEKNKLVETAKTESAKWRVDYENLQTELQSTKHKYSELKRDLQETMTQLQHEEARRKDVEEKLQQIQEQHVNELRVQADQFNAMLLEERHLSAPLHNHPPIQTESALDFDIGHEQHESVNEQQQHESVNEQQQQEERQDHEEFQRNPVIRALQARVQALEEANRSLAVSKGYSVSKPLSPDRIRERQLLEDQASTIHQLTLEVEQNQQIFAAIKGKIMKQHANNNIIEEEFHDGKELSAQDLEASVVEVNDHHKEEEKPRNNKVYLEQEVVALQVRLQQELHARRTAEQKVSFLQAEFTELFMEYFAKDSHKRLKDNKENRMKASALSIASSSNRNDNDRNKRKGKVRKPQRRRSLSRGKPRSMSIGPKRDMLPPAVTSKRSRSRGARR